MHIQTSGYIDASDYIEWWRAEGKPKKEKGRGRASIRHNPDSNMSKKREPKQIEHDHYILLPWEWEINLTVAGTCNQQKVTSKAKGKKAEMYVQGDALFLLMDGFTQKLTANHKVTIIDSDKKRYENEKPRQIIEWAQRNEMRNRALALGLKAEEGAK